MKKFVLFFVIVLFSFQCRANKEAIRQELDIAWKDEKYANDLMLRLESKLTIENQGYLAVCYMMKSNHSSLPWSKLKYFYKGKKLLEKAIKDEPHRVELRFFRYEIQTKIPKGLNYDNIEEDKKIMLEYMNEIENKKQDEKLFLKIQKLNLKKV